MPHHCVPVQVHTHSAQFPVQWGGPPKPVWPAGPFVLCPQCPYQYHRACQHWCESALSLPESSWFYWLTLFNQRGGANQQTDIVIFGWFLSLQLALREFDRTTLCSFGAVVSKPQRSVCMGICATLQSHSDAGQNKLTEIAKRGWSWLASLDWFVCVKSKWTNHWFF